MSANLADQPTTAVSRKLPPSERDFEIYEAIHVDGCSTRSMALKHDISQTRVRQIIRRVVEWMGEVLPPQAKIARQQEAHLARQIAASRFQHQYEQATRFLEMTQESKYASIRIRITTAQARLGVVGGIVDGLAADAIEGIPVPAWQPQTNEAKDENRVDGPTAEADPTSKIKIRESWLPPDAKTLARFRRSFEPFPAGLNDPISYDELTPEIVAARAAWGYPIPPELIEYAQQHGSAWPRTEAASAPTDVNSTDGTRSVPATYSPPVEDFSDGDDDSALCAEPPAEHVAESPSAATACDHVTSGATDTSEDECLTSQPLLTRSARLPVAEVRVDPAEPGAVVSTDY